MNFVCWAVGLVMGAAIAHFEASAEKGDVKKEMGEIREWAREGQCRPSRYWEGTWVCEGEKADGPSVWFERKE